MWVVACGMSRFSDDADELANQATQFLLGRYTNVPLIERRSGKRSAVYREAASQ